MSQSPDEFFTQKYSDLLSFCRQRWNGHGEDVLHQTYVILRERYQTVTFSLFMVVTREAARVLGLHRRGREVPLRENIPYSEQSHESKEDPRLERLHEVLVLNHVDPHVDPEEVNKYMMSKIQAEIFGQLCLFCQFGNGNEEGR